MGITLATSPEMAGLESSTHEHDAPPVNPASVQNGTHPKRNTRELVQHYRETRLRLNKPPAPYVPAPDPEAARQHKENMRELARLRLETKIFRDFLTERGVDVVSVLNRKRTLPTEIEQLTIKQIVDAVCERFMVNRVDIAAHRRTKQLTVPRHVVFYLARTLTGRSLPAIGRFMGDRDHTTVMNGIQRIEMMIRKDMALAQDVALLHIDLGIGGKQ